MTFILIDDMQKCNNCRYWANIRNTCADIACADLNSIEYGICLCPNTACYGQLMESCEGCTLCKKMA